LVADGAPTVARQDPAALFPSHRLGQRDERRGIAGNGPPNTDHGTTVPKPPRRGSPAASKAPSAERATAWTPPKKRLRSLQRTTSQSPSSPSGAASGQPPSR